jgi:deazaflavin-dependent oxidoreductase (nitroreductase family)
VAVLWWSDRHPGRGDARAGAGDDRPEEGEPRSVLLTYLDYDDGFVAIATNAGDDRFPAWWLNLEADPTAAVVVGGRRHDVRAREALGEERARLWQRAVDANDGYAGYADGLARRVPVVVLEPAG